MRHRLRGTALRARSPIVVAAVALLGVSILVSPSAGAQSSDGAAVATDFSEYAVGSGVPDGWSEHWGFGRYEIAESPSRLVMRGAGGGRHLLAWDDVGVVDGDVEVATLVRQPESTLPEMPSTRFQVHLHASGTAGAINSYHMDYTGTSRQGSRIWRSVNNVQSSLGNAHDPRELHVWHNVVFQRRGDMLRAKIWPYLTDEPAEWTVEAADDSHQSGRVGLGFFSDRVTQEFAWFAVGTGDQEARRAPDGIAGIPRPQVPEAPSPDGAAKYAAALLDWDPVDGADHYEIERDGELVAHGWEIPSYADASLPPGTTATYRVRGVSVLAGAGEWSEPVEVEAAPPPDQLPMSFETEPGYPWTSHDEELAFLDQLAEASPRMDYEVIGHSGEGRPMHLARIGLTGPPSDAEIAAKPTVLFTGSNHGDEPAGRQAILLLMRELATSQDASVLDWLSAYTVLVIPTINPDGRAADTRNLVIPNIDANRDFMALTSAETQTVTSVLRDHRPDAVIDAHEFGTFPGQYRGEIEVSTAGHANVHPDVVEVSSEMVFDRVMTGSNQSAGWRSQPYQELYGQPSRLRQITGVRHALSMLTESSRLPEIRRLDEAGLALDHPQTRPRRVASHRFALSAALRFLTENVDRVRAATAASAAAAEANVGRVYTDGSVAFPPEPEQTLDPPPCGWIVTGADGSGVVDTLELHGIESERRRFPGGQQVLFVPAAQWARPVAVAALDPGSADRLGNISTARLADSGWCRRGAADRSGTDTATATPGHARVAGVPAQAQKSGNAEVFTTDFSEHVVGVGVPAGWVELFDSSHYEIAAVPSRLVKVSDGSLRHVLGWDEAGVVDGDVEVATLLRVPQASLPTASTTRFQLHLHASGATEAINSYHVDYTGTAGTVRIRRSVDHAQTTLASVPAQFDMDGWHHVVFQRRGNVLRAKIWPYYTAEPDGWTVQAEDDTHHSGRVGPGYFNTAGPTQEFAWFSVGTAGQQAERAPDGIEGIPEPTLPGQIELTAAARYGAVALDWPATGGADYYDVERDGQLLTRRWDIPSYADATIAPGATATYRVRGVSTLHGAGEWSQPVDVTATPLPDQLVLPFERGPDAPWTSHEQELAFLSELADISPRVGVEEIGRSGQGRPLHLVRFGLDGPPDDAEIAARPTALIACSMHGNEPAGREGCLWLMRELATSQDPEVLDWLDTYAVLVIPAQNPDGLAASTRSLVSPNIDGNRDHVALTSAETRAIAAVLRDHQPDVVIDAHEWLSDPGHRRGELEMSAAGNVNAHGDVLDLSSELAFDTVMYQSNEAAGWRSRPYQTLTGRANLLHEIGALKHAVTFLTESSTHPETRRVEESGGSGDAPSARQRRVASQRFALSAALRFLTESVDRVRAATAASVAAAAANDGPLYTAGSVVAPPEPGQTLDPPVCGWALPGADGAGIADVLELHGIAWANQRLPGGQWVTFVPAAQRARPLAVVTLDGASQHHLTTTGSIRMADSGWCKRGGGR